MKLCTKSSIVPYRKLNWLKLVKFKAFRWTFIEMFLVLNVTRTELKITAISAIKLYDYC